MALVAPPTALAAWYCYAYEDTKTQAHQDCLDAFPDFCGCLDYYGTLPGTNIPDAYSTHCNSPPPGWPGWPMWCAPRPETPCPAGSHFGPTGCASPALKKTNGHPTDCNASAGNPCNAATGNKFQTETDYRSSDAGSSLVRYYNSQLSGDLNFGVNWTSSFLGKHIDTSQAPRVGVFRADGRGEPSTCSNGTCTGDADSKLALTQDAAGYTLTLRDNTIERYNLTGKIVSETSPTGQTANYGFDTSGRLATVTDVFGHTLTFGYNTNNHISTVTDSAGQVIGYTYDINNNLTRVDYPDATAKIYHYNEPVFTSGTNLPNHLTGISYVDSAGVTTRYATYAYDTNGKAITTQHAQTDNGAPQEKFTLAYNSDTQTTVTNPVNMQEVMTFSIINLGVKNLVNKVNQSDSKSVAQTFDPNNNLTCRKDEESRVTLYYYNTATNQRTSMTEGMTGNCTAPVSVAGVTRTTTYQYLSPTLDLPTVIESPSVVGGTSKKRITLAYGDSRFPALPTGITQSGYTPAGVAVSRTVTLGYNPSGQVNSLNGPRTDVSDITTLEYNVCTTGGACGQLQRVTNALGHITTYDLYDANGQLKQMIDPNGLRTSYTYDTRGRVKTITQIPTRGASAVTQYSYTAWGDVSQVIDPDGVTLTYGYDAAHYLRTITAADGYLYYTYDLKGNRTEEDIYNTAGSYTRWTSYGYDLRNHLANITTTGNFTQLVHDAVGNLTAQTDGNNHGTAHSYDALNRLFKTVDALSGETGYGYDVSDKVKQITAPNNLATQYQYDDLGNLLQEVSPDRGTLTYTYDAASNVLTVTNGRGDVTTYTYDALNRVVYQENTDTNSPWFNYFYDSCKRGRLCTIQKNDAFDMSFNYDNLGRLSYQFDANWLYTGYAYTLGGRLSRITYPAYPSGRSVDYTYDIPGGAGRVTKVTTTSNGTTTVLAQNLAYYPFGPLTNMTYGNGLFLSVWLDDAYRPVLRYAGAYAESGIVYDGADNITRMSTAGQQSYAYDPVNRLTAASATVTRPRGSTTDSWGYGYDGNGNRQSETRNGVTTAYYYYPDSNQLFHAGNDWRLMDAAGNTRLGTAFGWLVYDGYGRMVSALSGAASYDYNAFHQRTRKTVNGLTTSFHYGPQGELLYESDGTNTKAYVYLNGVPLARIDNNSQVYYYHTDRLGTPQAMTDSAGTVVWRASYEPFGKATVTVSTIANNLRYAGMYSDSETGLFYNWFRYYDPKIGGYITVEPLGVVPGVASSAVVPREITEYFQSIPLNDRLVRGLNHPYRYAYNNPLTYIDPDGLFKMYGNWGGANYSGGQSGSTVPENPTPPKDTLDACYKQHDYCYAATASKSGDSQSASCSTKPTIQDCDRQLAKCTLHVNYKSIGWWGKLFGPASTTWAVFKGELAK